jgi:hypothetical protein
MPSSKRRICGRRKKSAQFLSWLSRGSAALKPGAARAQCVRDVVQAAWRRSLFVLAIEHLALACGLISICKRLGRPMTSGSNLPRYESCTAPISASCAALVRCDPGVGRFVHVALAKGLCHTQSMGEINEHRGCGDFTPEAGRVTPKPGFIALTRRAALIVVLAGAAGSLGLMFRAGRRQNSKILLLLFAI